MASPSWLSSRNLCSIWINSGKRRRTKSVRISSAWTIFSTEFCVVSGGVTPGTDLTSSRSILGNKPHSNCTQRHFTFNDPRTKYSMRRCDPRIHFVINCGARSSPQITIYSSSHLEKALNMATTSYCNTEVEIDMEKNEVFLPKLFLWYRNDFGRSDCDVLRSGERRRALSWALAFVFICRWITKFIDEPKRSLLQALLDQQVSKDGLHLSYTVFDWMLNDYS